MHTHDVQEFANEVVARRQFIFTRVYQAEQMLDQSADQLSANQSWQLKALVDDITGNFNDVSATLN